MFIETAQGKQIDVGAKFADNLHADTLLRGSTNLNPLGIGPADPTLHRSAASPNFGDWFKVPDDQIRGHALPFPGAPITKTWKLDNGRKITLDSDEIRANSDWANIFSATEYTYNDCYVKYTPNTRPGMIALGIVRVDPNAPPEQPPGQPATPSQAVISSARALVVLAVVGAAIYFLPKGILKGGA